IAVASVLLTGAAPVVSAMMTPSTGTLTLSGGTPFFSSTTGTLILTGKTPSPVSGTVLLTLAGQLQLVTFQGSVATTPFVGSLVLTGARPSVATLLPGNTSATPSSGNLVLGDAGIVTALQGTLTVQGQTFSVVTGLVFTPSIATLTFTTSASVVSAYQPGTG